MQKRIKQQKIVIIGLSCIVLLMAVGYAAFQSILKINGVSNISGTWDVEITGITKDQTKGNVTEVDKPTFDKESATFNVGLELPGDYIYYKVAVTNKGTLSAIATLGNLSCGDSNILECGAYAEESGLGSTINENTDLTNLRLVIGPNETDYYYIWVKYKIDGPSSPNITKTNIKLELTYEQSDVGITHQTEDKCYTGKVLEDGTISITDYDNSCGTDIVVPERIDGIPVTDIAAGRYDNNLGFISPFAKSSITSVILPNTIKYIGYAAFYGNDLTALTIPDSVREIGTYSFSDNKISNLHLGNSVNLINAWAFSGNRLTSVDLPASLRTIGTVAFYMNQLTSINIPGTVITIGGGAFNANSVPAKDAVIYAHNSDGSVNTSKVVSYAGRSFTTIPENVTEIYEYAYYHIGCTEVTIPQNVTTIGTRAFDSVWLKKVNFNSKLVTIKEAAFSSNVLTNIDIPDSVTDIGTISFQYNNLQTVKIGSGIKSIGANAFQTYGGYNPITAITINRKQNSVPNSPWGASAATINWTGTN